MRSPSIGALSSLGNSYGSEKNIKTTGIISISVLLVPINKFGLRCLTRFRENYAIVIARILRQIYFYFCMFTNPCSLQSNFLEQQH